MHGKVAFICCVLVGVCLVHISHLWFQPASRVDVFWGANVVKASLCVVHPHSLTPQHPSFPFFEPTHTNHTTLKLSSSLLKKLSLRTLWASCTSCARAWSPGSRLAGSGRPRCSTSSTTRLATPPSGKPVCIVFGASSVSVLDGVREVSIMLRLR